MQVLILAESEVGRLAEEGLVMSAVEEAFRLDGLGQVQMPEKSYLTFSEYHGDLRTMPAYLPSLNAAGVKVVNSHPENPKAGLPTVMALVILNDPQNGQPLAIIAGSALTAIRTGAAGALAAKLLAPPNAERAGFIGGGTQARQQLKFLMRVRPIRSIQVYDIDRKKAEGFCEYARQLGISGATVAAAAQEPAGEPIVVTTTPGQGPVCGAEAFRPGSHVNAIGADAPGKQELPPAILSRAKVVVDSREQAAHSGEINVPIAKGLYRPDRIHATLGEIVAGKKPGRTADSEVTLFDSTGVAILDIALAKKIYDLAVGQKAGKIVGLDQS
ncbi:MAG: hypothetical protein A3G34_02835 [Candidatus Lindowbacteria bacterium RIFCSPLOWO2_12_FULL_62_27]|nr:MAG: hypothetical protein A3G34_02835 [Candidatus Lindowbacteria bacterium RIFCSPLOWO2_12_FULL_62_27]OGH64026.1 MAG: hypothetical protein A3I06_01605 [Candidatus Lindowbacteria bacterium RIFCSPLOWO2_02_FULL_62_12]